jgi:hypothetical protein
MREDTYEVTLSINGEGYGIWDKFAGGAITSAELKYRPGGMRPQRSLGGTKTVENVTLSRLHDEEVQAMIPALEELVGNGSCVVTKQLLSPRGAPIGSPIVYTGTLQSLTPPDHDSEGEDAGLTEIEISTDGAVGT